MRILIVDDEHFACAALEKLVNDYFREQNRPVSCLTFEDSILALEYICENEADLLMTDIRMSGVDGLKLAETVKAKRPDMETVVISGYADFTYAQTALKCDVSDYLLKPISRKQIYTCLEEQVRHFHEKGEKKREMETARKQAVYHHISSGASFDTATLSALFDVKVKENSLAVMVMFCKKGLFFTSDREYFKDCMKMREIGVAEAWNPAGTVVLLVLYTERVEKDVLRKRVLQQCGLCRRNLTKERRDCEITVSVSRVESLKELAELFRQCNYAMNEKIISPGRCLFDYSKVTEKAYGHVPLDTSFEHELKRSFEFFDQELSKEIIERQMKMLVERKEVSLWSLTEFISKVLAVLNKIIYAFNMESESQIEYLPETFLGQFETIGEIRRYFHLHIDRIYDGMSNERMTDNVVDRLVKYVEENYYLNISLAKAAENVFYMNSSYLSRLFKSQKEVSFSKFLLDYRLKKAMEYIETSPKISVQEVASLTGFSDGSYFVKQFKKYYGETPGFYQRNSLKKIRK